jgi:hypothetical protein
VQTLAALLCSFTASTSSSSSSHTKYSQLSIWKLQITPKLQIKNRITNLWAKKAYKSYNNLPQNFYISKILSLDFHCVWNPQLHWNLTPTSG